MANLDIEEAREQFLEMAADHLLRTTPHDPERPTYTEQQLSQRWRRMLNIGALVDGKGCPSQTLRDEMRFLMSVTRMDPEYRRCLRLWVDGWTQEEIAHAYHVSQQVVSYRLKRALRSCYAAAPISFRRFSQHTIYRKRRTRTSVGARRCAHCGEEFLIALGCGTLCSPACQERRQRDENGGNHAGKPVS
jgi:hypothetical protein